MSSHKEVYYDFNDIFYYIRSNGKKDKQYKHWCLSCKKDRGYAFKNKILKEPLCHSCKMKTKEVKDKISKSSSKRTHSIKTRHQISKSLYKTYNSSPLLRKIGRNLRSRLNKAIKGNYKTGSAVRDLGCSIKELKKYLESKWQQGMSWDNYGEWHIDHIKPLNSFDLEDEEQLKEACHYTNLQPLWAKDNLKKGSKY